MSLPIRYGFPFFLGLASACGGNDAPEAATTPVAPVAPVVPAAPQSELRTEHLPPALAFVRFGVTTPEEVKARFNAPNLYVTDDGDRDLRVMGAGPNTGRPKRNVFVTRNQDGTGYAGALGDDYGAISFDFTSLTDGGPFVLFRIEVSQPGATGSLCQPASALATGAGLEGCDANDVYLPSAPAANGAYHACVDHMDGRVIYAHCTVNSDSRSLRYELAVGRQAAL